MNQTHPHIPALPAAKPDHIASQYRAIGISAVAAALSISGLRPAEPAITDRHLSQASWMQRLAA